jgi:glycosyltransferase involved in cell wall biosynthesis
LHSAINLPDHLPVRIALISPELPPDRGGISDYVSRLTGELTRNGHSVLVITAQEKPAPIPGAELKSVAYPWGSKGLREVSSAVMDWRPDATVVQFAPLPYSPKLYGIHPGLPLWLAALKRKSRKPVVLMSHEPYYPPGILPDRLLIGVPHFLTFHAMVQAVDRTLFTTQVWRNAVAGRMPWRRKRISWLPVAANLEAKEEDLLRRAQPGHRGIPEDAPVLLQFGGGHSTRLFGHIWEALQECKRERPDCRLVLAGLTQAEIAPLLPLELQDSVTALGYLPEKDTLQWLARADIVLAPFIDGISARRTSVMAALSAGRPVVTNRSYQTDPEVNWGAFLRLAPNDVQGYARSVASLLADAPERQRLSQKARETYLAEFSWDRLIQRFLSELRAAGARTV